MTLGPVQLVVLGFTGNATIEEMFSELRAVREKNIIRLLSLLFVRKAGEWRFDSDSDQRSQRDRNPAIGHTCKQPHRFK